MRMTDAPHDALGGPDRMPRGIGGWLAVLCGLLLVWQPVQLAVSASNVLDSLPIRGGTLVWVLALRLVVAALGIAAGLALAGRRPAAVALAKVSLVASAATDAFVYSTPYFPSRFFPGDAPLFVGASLLYHGGWFAYLMLSKRVRNTFST
jgi:hypothetical protein